MKTISLAEDLDVLVSDDRGSAVVAEARAFLGDIRRGAASGAEEIVRLGTLLGLDFHRVLALALKYEWERLLAQMLGGEDRSALGDVDTRLLKRRFVPDCDALFLALARHGQVPNGIAYDPPSLADTIQEMLLIDLHMLANTAPELQAFAQRNRQALELLRRGSREAQDSFRSLKREWLAFQDELGERLLYLERRRLDNENLHQRWLAVFGEVYVALMEQAARFDRLQRRIELKTADPALTRETLEQLVADTEAAQRLQLKRLRHRLSLAPFRNTPPGVTPISHEELGEYRRQCKLALREVWLLIHPDKLAQHAQYAELTADQTTLLGELWHRAMTVRDEELGFEPGFVGAEYRSLPVLLDIIATVKDILGQIGVDTNVALVVKGDSLEDQIGWLRRSIQRLEGELDGIQAELIALINDPNIQERAALLAASLEQQEQARREMQNRAHGLGERAERMEAHLVRLFEAEHVHA